MKYSIMPSIIAHSQQELRDRIKKISTLSKSIHLDIMDGEFVPRTSMEFDFILPKSYYEAHLMVSDPHAWMLAHNKKMNSILVHYESLSHIHDIIKTSSFMKKKIGIALNPETPIEDITQYIKIIDKLLIMTVHPGKYGSEFLPEMLHKITEARKLAPKLDIEVDGGMNPENIMKCKKAGANQFIVGSYLQNASNIKKAWDELNKALN